MGGAPQVREMRYYQTALGIKGEKGLRYWYVILGVSLETTECCGGG